MAAAAGRKSRWQRPQYLLPEPSAILKFVLMIYSKRETAHRQFQSRKHILMYPFVVKSIGAKTIRISKHGLKFKFSGFSSSRDFRTVKNPVLLYGRKCFTGE